jgi:phosphoheptose isomerase
VNHRPTTAAQASTGSLRLLDTRVVQRIRSSGLNLDELETAVGDLLTCFRAGGKVLAFGNGGSAADAQHMAAELVGRVRLVRPPLPAIALTTDTSVLTAIANDAGFEQIFARQVTALGRPGDIAVAISTSGMSGNVLAGVKAAHEVGMRVVAITGRADTSLARDADVAVTVATGDAQRVQEAHLVAEHALCESVETHLFGDCGSRPGAREPVQKVLELPDLFRLRPSWRARGQSVVWTNGVFDLLHLGHVRALEMAKDFGDILVVGVNTDETVRTLKGETRPVVPERERADVVAALAVVDYVTIFGDPDPSDILRELQPDVHCKGDEYADRLLPEREVVERYGGRIEFIPRVRGLSSTALIRRSIEAVTPGP